MGQSPIINAIIINLFFPKGFMVDRVFQSRGMRELCTLTNSENAIEKRFHAFSLSSFLNMV